MYIRLSTPHRRSESDPAHIHGISLRRPIDVEVGESVDIADSEGAELKCEEARLGLDLFDDRRSLSPIPDRFVSEMSVSESSEIDVENLVLLYPEDDGAI